MAARNVAEPNGDAPALDDGIYVDASTLAKIYLPEPDSDQIDAFSQALNYAFNRPRLEWSDVGLGPTVFVNGIKIN
jgi:hypothetical protein